MDLQREVAGLQGQPPARCDSRAQALVLCPGADKEASREDGGAQARPPPLSASVPVTWPSSSLGPTSRPSMMTDPSSCCIREVPSREHPVAVYFSVIPQSSFLAGECWRNRGQQLRKCQQLLSLGCFTHGETEAQVGHGPWASWRKELTQGLSLSKAGSPQVLGRGARLCSSSNF